MFIGSKERSCPPKPQESPSGLRQNYVAFINKSPRFQQNAEKIKKLPNINLDLRNAQSLLRPSPSKDKNATQLSQYFFKSDIERFGSPLPLQATPSPVDYQPQQLSKSRERAKERLSPHQVLPAIRTIPTIPDTRNKYGYNFESNTHSLVSKSSQQLEKERTLMKEYQASLVNEKSAEKKVREAGSVPRIRDLEGKVSQLFRSSQFAQKENKTHESCSLLEPIKPKFHHLYEYHPVAAQEKLLLSESAKPPKQSPVPSPKKSKFQFFNSSERRFKTVQSQSPIFKAKPSVRQYISKFLNINI